MSKLKQAREALKAVERMPEKSRRREILQISLYVKHKNTILTALNALERMQGVEGLDGCDDENSFLSRVRSAMVLHGARAYYLPEDIEVLLNAAQTLADMKKEVE